MKIITWNCNMAFRKKANFILTHQPDILIVPECEHPDKLKFEEKNLPPLSATCNTAFKYDQNTFGEFINSVKTVENIIKNLAPCYLILFHDNTYPNNVLIISK